MSALAAALASAGVALALTIQAPAVADDVVDPGETSSPTTPVDPTDVPTTPTDGPTPTQTPTTSGPTDPTTPPSTEPPTSPPTTAPTDDTDDQDEPLDGVEVDDAVFAWSMNQQSNARSHNPLALNFFSAGSVGAVLEYGEWLVKEPSWRATAGNVRIEKLNRKGVWQKATWDGLDKDSSGRDIQSEGPFSGHRVRLSKGTGVVDPKTRSAQLEWKGTWSVVYYSGNSIFTVTDPQLTVEGGKGTLTAELGGWAGARDDLSQRDPVTPRRVQIATLAGARVTESGITVTPAYAGVKVTGTIEQRRDENGWGAFPQPMIDFLGPLGVDQFWYSTGLRADWTKKAEQITVGFDGTVPSTGPTPPQAPETTPSNPVVERPDVTPAVPLPSAPVASVPVPVTDGAALSAAPVRPVQVVDGADARATAAPAAAPLSDPELWWATFGLLLASALLLLAPLPARPRGARP